MTVLPLAQRMYNTTAAVNRSRNVFLVSFRVSHHRLRTRTRILHHDSAQNRSRKVYSSTRITQTLPAQMLAQSSSDCRAQVPQSGSRDTCTLLLRMQGGRPVLVVNMLVHCSMLTHETRAYRMWMISGLFLNRSLSFCLVLKFPLHHCCLSCHLIRIY